MDPLEVLHHVAHRMVLLLRFVLNDRSSTHACYVVLHSRSWLLLSPCPRARILLPQVGLQVFGQQEYEVMERLASVTTVE